MDTWHSVADQKIQEAMEQGAFRDLPGQGRPLRLQRNPCEPPELHMAHTILEAAGMSPAWVQERRALDEDVEQVRATLRTKGSADWPRAVEDFRRAVANLNRRILT